MFCCSQLLPTWHTNIVSGYIRGHDWLALWSNQADLLLLSAAVVVVVVDVCTLCTLLEVEPCTLYAHGSLTAYSRLPCVYSG